MHPIVLILENAHRFEKKDVRITALEIDILYWSAENLSHGGIGEKVFLSARTINSHRGKLYGKTGCSTPAGLDAFAHKHKLLFYRKGVLMKHKGNIKPLMKK